MAGTSMVGRSAFWRGLGASGSLCSRLWNPGALGVQSVPGGTPRSCILQKTRCFIQMRSKLKVADNSGAKIVSCIRVVGGGKGGKIGDTIIASVKEVTSHKRRLKKFDTKDTSKVKKGEVVACVIVRAAMQRPRSDGSHVKFDENAVVVVNKEGEPVGTRVFGPVAAELRAKKFVKVLSLAEHVV